MTRAKRSRLDFLKRLQAACPIRIQTILTDNGAQLPTASLPGRNSPPANVFVLLLTKNPFLPRALTIISVKGCVRYPSKPCHMRWF
jgi:hypothetical protein